MVNFVLIRDILMYAGALIGVCLIAYVRISFSSRQQKTSVPLQYNERELKLRKAAIIILVITVLLCAIPVKYL